MDRKQVATSFLYLWHRCLRLCNYVKPHPYRHKICAIAEAVKEQVALESLLTFDVPVKPLVIREGNITPGEQSGILFSFEDYLQLVDYTDSP